MPPFLDMGKYAAFVWPAYGISMAGIFVALLQTLRAYLRAKARLQSLERARE